jgi:hypothetical protein
MTTKKLDGEASELRRRCRIGDRPRPLWTLRYSHLVGEHAADCLIQKLVILKAVPDRRVHLKHSKVFDAEDSEQTLRPCAHRRKGQQHSEHLTVKPPSQSPRLP